MRLDIEKIVMRAIEKLDMDRMTIFIFFLLVCFLVLRFCMTD